MSMPSVESTTRLRTASDPTNHGTAVASHLIFLINPHQHSKALFPCQHLGGPRSTYMIQEGSRIFCFRNDIMTRVRCSEDALSTTRVPASLSRIYIGQSTIIFLHNDLGSPGRPAFNSHHSSEGMLTVNACFNYSDLEDGAVLPPSRSAVSRLLFLLRCLQCIITVDHSWWKLSSFWISISCYNRYTS